MDFSTDLLVQNPLAAAVFGLGAVGAAWRAWRMTNSGDSVQRANNEANISAIAAWKEMAERERMERVEAMSRADMFARERNEAMAQVHQMQGKLQMMTETLAAQSQEIGELREQVRQLREAMGHAL